MDALPLRIPGLHPSAQTIEVIVKLYGNKIYKLALHMTGSHADAEDVVQDVFYKLFRDWAILSSKRNLSAWIHRVVTNACIDLLRARKKRAQTVESSSLEAAPLTGRLPEPGHLLQSEELREKIENAVRELSPQQVACLILHDHEGLKPKEIAGILGVTPVTVRSYLCQARQRIKDLLRPYFKEGTE